MLSQPPTNKDNKQNNPKPGQSAAFPQKGADIVSQKNQDSGSYSGSTSGQAIGKYER